ncbi:zinc finger protein 431 [Bombyx mori]|uniref:Uncharacterized protein n=1 Tax=Bombyx mori TaxID=7091 RepID=A0A8R1WGM6_BOMMO|nr:zinc finger protein 431 [Bombyx mori]
MDKNICRLCCENRAETNIFESKQGEISVSSKIMYCCSGLQIKSDDGLPSKICEFCKKELDACYYFVLKCEAADKRLRLKIAEKPKFDATKTEIKLEADDDDNHWDEETFALRLCDVDIKSEFTEQKAEVRKKRRYTKRTKYKRRQDGSCKCPVCGRVCINPSTLTIHMRVHSSEKSFSCTVCNSKYKDAGNLKRHMNRKHDPMRQRQFVCENCGKAFYSKRDVEIHMRTHTGETPYTCNACGKSFTQATSLFRHRLRHESEKTYSCTICNKLFRTKDGLRNHALVHTSEKKFSCPICNMSFKYKNNVHKHIKNHSEPKRFVCNYCGRSFSMKGGLKSHIDRQHSEKSGYCNVCSKHVPNLEVHSWKHTGQRPLKCELCSSSFSQLKALTHHVNFKHKQTSKHKCLVAGCEMAFPSKPMLDYHTAKVHSTDIPFPCDRCSRGFYRKNDLSRHMIGTHKEKLL